MEGETDGERLGASGSAHAALIECAPLSRTSIRCEHCIIVEMALLYGLQGRESARGADCSDGGCFERT